MQVPDTPLREAGSISGAVGVVRKDETTQVAAVATATARPASARSIKASSPRPWTTATAPL